MRNNLQRLNNHSQLEAAHHDFVALVSTPPTNPATAFHEIVGSMHQLTAAIAYAEQSGLKTEEIAQIVASAKQVHATSPFVHRLQTWPRGYPGDCETIEQIVNQENHAPTNTWAYWLEEYALCSAASQQHRNKVYVQARIIADCVCRRRQNRRPARILLIAAGACPDLSLIEGIIAPYAFEIVVNDADPAALALAKQKLGCIGQYLTFREGNIFSAARQLRRDEPFDLVLAGGLYDYLDERAAGALTSIVIDKLLRPDGLFFFTNIAQGNLFRPWIEHLANWHLIERCELTIREMIQRAAKSGVQVQLNKDLSGLAHLVEVKRAGPAI